MADNPVIGQVLNRIGDNGNRTRQIDRLNAIAEAYRQALGRDPDASGLEAYANKFANQDVNIPNLVQELKSSPEGQTKIQNEQKAADQKATDERFQKVQDTATATQKNTSDANQKIIQDLMTQHNQFKTDTQGQIDKLMGQITANQTKATSDAQLTQQDFQKRHDALGTQLQDLGTKLGLTPEQIQNKVSGLGNQYGQLQQQLGLDQGGIQNAVQDRLSQGLNQVAKTPYDLVQQQAMNAGNSALEQRGLTRSGSAPELAQNVASQVGMARAQAQQGAYGQANTLQDQLRQMANQFGQANIGAQQQLGQQLGGQAQQLGQFGTQLGQAQSSQDLSALQNLVSQFSGQAGQAGQAGFGAQQNNGQNMIQQLLQQLQTGQGQNFQQGNQMNQNQFGYNQQQNQNQFQNQFQQNQNQFDLQKQLATTPKQQGPDFLSGLGGILGGIGSIALGPLGAPIGAAVGGLLGGGQQSQSNTGTVRLPTRIQTNRTFD